MKTTRPGCSIDVSVGEVFGVLRAGRETSGYKVDVSTPEGVVHLGTERASGGGFGASAGVTEKFRATRGGSYHIVLKVGRPWEPTATAERVDVNAH